MGIRRVAQLATRPGLENVCRARCIRLNAERDSRKRFWSKSLNGYSVITKGLQRPRENIRKGSCSETRMKGQSRRASVFEWKGRISHHPIRLIPIEWKGRISHHPIRLIPTSQEGKSGVAMVRPRTSNHQKEASYAS